MSPLTGVEVAFSDGTVCTMLPPGRAAGRLWLSFVVANDRADIELSEVWLPGRQVTFYEGDQEVRADEGGGGGGDDLWFDHYSFTQSGLDVVFVDLDGRELRRIAVGTRS